MVYEHPYLMLAEEHGRELRQQAEAERLARQVLAARAKGAPFYYQALEAVGRRLSAWGGKLQRHYGQPKALPLERAAQRK